MTVGRSRTRAARRSRTTTATLAVAAVMVAGALGAGCQADRGDPSPEPVTATPSAGGSTPSRPDSASAWDTAPDSLAAVGDSITTGFHACGPLAPCPEASWATGTDRTVDSLARRLLDRPARDSWNLAETGATMADLRSQMSRAAAHDPGIVTVLAGANDACRRSVDAMTPVRDFRARFTAALRALWEDAPRAQVYVSSIPDLRRLWEVGRKVPDARRAWDLGICPSLLRDPLASDPGAEARRQRVLARVEAYNATLREVCTAERRCRWDGGAVHDHRFTAESLSDWDWFHPSREGQRVLAEIAHARVTAP